MYHCHVIHVRPSQLAGQRTIFAKRLLRMRNDRAGSPVVVTVAVDRGGEESREAWAWHRRSPTSGPRTTRGPPTRDTDTGTDGTTTSTRTPETPPSTRSTT